MGGRPRGGGGGVCRLWGAGGCWVQAGEGRGLGVGGGGREEKRKKGDEKGGGVAGGRRSGLGPEVGRRGREEKREKGEVRENRRPGGQWWVTGGGKIAGDGGDFGWE
ncbi:hypothetical protein TIFTF001_026401 [Ficus carica]|uniref:Uncharacterized protein n=1 Tax=Ficus carica TaxID=3494 RepID=A0AA88DL80_FICCA|nr:hypothetical protein TIFTF001_026401 [Ficus carica]